MSSRVVRPISCPVLIATDRSVRSAPGTERTLTKRAPQYAICEFDPSVWNLGAQLKLLKPLQPDTWHMKNVKGKSLTKRVAGCMPRTEEGARSILFRKKSYEIRGAGAVRRPLRPVSR
eukprot:123868-Rhodomonas_salina.2